MNAYLTGRLLQSAVVLLAMSFVVHMLIGLMPGDPVDLMVAANPHATATDAARLRAIYGVDQPLVERYGRWLGAALQGDFGFSNTYKQPVMQIVWPRLVNTLVLMSASLALAVLIALPVGVMAARRPYGFFDTVVNLFCFAGISVPPFWLALLMISLFAVTLGWFPAGGMGPPGAAGDGIALEYAVLPVAALTLASVGGYTRHVRSAMMGALRQDHIRTAYAKGLGEARVIFKHALPAALVPVLTLIALDFGTLFGGALITETMFSWSGMGKMIYDAIMANDFNLALVGLLFVTIMILAGNVLADLAYAWLDPRVSLEKTAEDG